MKTQLSFALFILFSAQAFAQSAKIAATQKASTSSSVRVSEQSTAASSASASTAATATTSTSIIQDKSTQARQQVSATGDAAIDAKHKTESEIRERLDNKTELGVSTQAGVKTAVKANSSPENPSIASNTNISTQPVIKAGSNGISRVEAVHAEAGGNVATGVHVVSKSAVAVNHEVKPVLKANSNFKATQSNRVKMKPVSVRSKTMTAGKVKL
jgi:hypothetical protein